jgi:tyrosine-protein kinase shark
VLSVYHDTLFWHYQIHQHGEDAFFSVNGQPPIHHGLEELIEFYKTSNTNLCMKLKSFVKKQPPPVETRKHGKKNLLHRAVTASNLDVVKEMMKTKERNLDAKDELGMTASHLACKHKVNPEIMKLLIDRGANLSSRDTSGNTPLHVSSKNVNWPRANHISFLYSTHVKISVMALR